MNTALLLEKVKQLIEFDKELSNQQKDRFNVFNVLNIESKEELLHSRFIGYLLNATDCPTLKKDFLQSFLRIIGVEDYFIKPNYAETIIEKSIGKVDFDSKEGGRIDIILRDNQSLNQVIIENKIYASDQKHQLQRYYNDAIKTTGKFKLLYLTLRPQEASSESKGELQEGTDYYNITYQDHIHKWIEECIKVSYEHHGLHETLKQYQKTLNNLLNRNNSSYMESRINELLKNPDNWEAARAIYQGLEVYRQNLNNDANYFITRLNENDDEIKKILSNSSNKVLQEATTKYWHHYYNNIDHYKIDLGCKSKNKPFCIIILCHIPRHEFVKELEFCIWIYDYHSTNEWDKYMTEKAEEFNLHSGNTAPIYSTPEELHTFMTDETIKIIRAMEGYQF